jgi:phosphohistidine swiveling domain-containing protein
MGNTVARGAAGPGGPPRGSGAPGASGSPLVALADPRATDVGLPTLPGVIVPVGVDLDGLAPDSPLVVELRRRLGPGPLIARSSSPIEDSADRSMAGRFESVGDLVDDAALVAAIVTVAASGARVAVEDDLEIAPPVAVLVQPMVHGVGGVCFGVEPVTGRSDRLVAVASGAGPEAVASGRVDGVRHLLTPDGRVLRRDGDDEDGVLSDAYCDALVTAMNRAGELFGSPQDVEFLFEADGTLRMLQSRPVTTEVRGPPLGPVYGTGPVAETFPDPLLPLERSLWVDPLRAGLREALRLASLASRRELAERELVVVVDGRVAMDLELAGDDRRRRRWYHPDLRNRGREAWATWRVGRLRGALPGLARDVVAHTDALLADVGPLGPRSDRQLVGLLDRSRDLLLSLHAHEILMGFLVTGSDSRLTGVSVAMRSLIAGRRDGLDDDEIVARSPVVLALTGPRLAGVQLPRHLDELAPPLPPEAVDDEAAVLREALRLRVRWVQELTARAARLLEDRLVERGAVDEPDAVAYLTFHELAEVVGGTAAPSAEALQARLHERADPPALPARFRLDAAGRPVPVDAGSGDGTGAGGGRARGRVVHDPDEAGPDTVLVVQDLSPRLGPVIGRIAALVAETGSPLAHVAILAREAGVPTVVGSHGATARFDVGTVVEVDGMSGTVVVVG